MPVVDINNIAETDFRHAQPASDIDTAAVDGLKALDPDLPIREADIGINLHVPLCFPAGTTDRRYWQAVACLGAAHETATCRSFRSLTGSTGAIGWHISNLKVDLGLHCGCRRHPHSGNGRL
jgi:hypothetical protein